MALGPGLRHWRRMKDKLLIGLGLVLTLMSGRPAWAVSGLRGQGPVGSAHGFGGQSFTRVPIIRYGFGPGGVMGSQRTDLPLIRRGPSFPADEGGRGKVSEATRSERSQPVQPKMIVVDPSGRTRTLRSSGRAATGEGFPSSGPHVITLNDPIAAHSTSPKVIAVNPTAVIRPVVPRVVVVNPSAFARHHGRRVIGTALSTLGTGLLLGEACEFDADLSDVCAPDDWTPLTVETAPGDAEVFLDGQSLGTADALSVQTLVIPPGRHGLEIVSPGREPFRLEFTATPSTPSSVHAARITQ